MITTGIIRRIDDLGRIVIPREIREQAFGKTSTEGKAMEFFYEKDGTIIMKPVGELTKAIADAEIDDIEDDQEFVEAENDFIRNYCIERNFNISEEDMNEIRERAMEDAFDFWKNEFENEMRVDIMSEKR